MIQVNENRVEGCDLGLELLSRLPVDSRVVFVECHVSPNFDLSATLAE